MLQKILSFLFSKTTEEEDDIEKGTFYPILKRDSEKEHRTAGKFQNIEMLTSCIDDFHFAGFRSVLNLELQFNIDFGDPKALLTIKFLYQQAHRDFEVVLRFKDPQSLSLTDLGSTFDISLMIEDISDLYWEDMKFTVDNYENAQMSFYCAAIEVLTVVERPGRR